MGFESLMWKKMGMYIMYGLRVGDSVSSIPVSNSVLVGKGGNDGKSFKVIAMGTKVFIIICSIPTACV